MAAPFALDIFTSLKGGILDTLGIDLQIFSPHGEVSAIDTIFNFAVNGCPLIIAARLAIEGEIATAIFAPVLLSIQHVVAFRTKTHAFELLIFSALAS